MRQNKEWGATVKEKKDSGKKKKKGKESVI